MKCDFERLVIQFQDLLVHDSILNWECGLNQIKILESILSQNLELNQKIEDQCHIPILVQFQRNKNMPICQCDYQKCGIVQVQYVDLKDW